MQNARDTFYVMLRTRLAALNPERTTVVRGQTRPGVMVPENELVSAGMPADVFCLGWKTTTVEATESLPLVTMGCEIRYATAGSDGGSGMDRGRMLDAMDAELLRALRQPPRAVLKTDYSTTPAKGLLTKIFWGEPVFGPVEVVGEQMMRSVQAEVFCFQEAGER